MIRSSKLTLSRRRLITLVDSQLLVSLQVASIGFFDCVFACVLGTRNECRVGAGESEEKIVFSVAANPYSRFGRSAEPQHLCSEIDI